MAYRVDLTRRAERDLEHLYTQISAEESFAAATWFNGLEDAIYYLEHLPLRCPIAPESKGAKRHFRHLLYGAKSDVYRIIYEIVETHKVVRILTVRHGAMDEFLGRRQQSQ